MTNLKKYENVLMFHLNDWKTIYWKWELNKMADILNKNQFVIIWETIINRNNIKKIEKQNLDDLDQFIFSQKEEVKNKLLEKRKRLKDNMGKEMSIKYAQNFVKQYLENNK